MIRMHLLIFVFAGLYAARLGHLAIYPVLAAEVKGDINKLFNFWDTWGWHRVTFYGDLKKPVQHLAGLTGFEVIEEA